MLPVCINLQNRRVLIVGGGNYALRKARNLVGEGCLLRIVSTSLLQDFRELDLDLEYIHGTYDSVTLDGVFMVFACTDDLDVNAQVLQDCIDRNILCTAAHHRDRSHFRSPVQWKGSDFSAALWTESGNPLRAQALRDLWDRFWRPEKHLLPKVFLVGFGPGNPDLMTLRAHRLCMQADVILYDDLIDRSFLAVYGARQVYVGKRSGQHSLSQNAINELLLAEARLGLLVVRLKGGDPFVFGRGGEELQFLHQNEIAVEIVPGITTALAAAAAAQVPLTHRGVSRSLTLQTAHHIDDSPPIYPQTGTLALYMGAQRLSILKMQLIDQGWLATTPVVLVHAASFESQKIEHCTLISMDLTRLPSPLCVIIGNSMTKS